MSFWLAMGIFLIIIILLRESAKEDLREIENQQGVTIHEMKVVEINNGKR